MDKKLQKLILRIIKESNGEATLRHLANKTTRKYWPDAQPSENTNGIIQCQLNLLEIEGKVIKRSNQPAGTSYI